MAITKYQTKAKHKSAIIEINKSTALTGIKCKTNGILKLLVPVLIQEKRNGEETIPNISEIKIKANFFIFVEEINYR